MPEDESHKLETVLQSRSLPGKIKNGTYSFPDDDDDNHRNKWRCPGNLQIRTKKMVQ